LKENSSPQALHPIEPSTSKVFTPPKQGDVITSLLTNNTYTIGQVIGEGNFGIVYSCTDDWNNELAVKILKPSGSYEKIRLAAEAEFQKLVHLRHPNITYIYDAFEYCDTFYIVTERCLFSLAELFKWPEFKSPLWVLPIARNLLQAVHFLHINQIVHQDIHTGNVFTRFAKDELADDSSATQFRLADLGIAKLFHGSSPRKMSQS
jgi:serine/threonine-protein kinase